MEFIGDIARKRGPCAALAVEAAKTGAAARIAERSARFMVPAVVRFDAERGELDTVRIAAFTSLLDLAVARDPALPAHCRAAGAAIATVHGAGPASELGVIDLPAPLAMSDAAQVLVHGDLTAANVGYDAASGRVVILDWSAAPSAATAATRGPAVFDVVWFMIYFFRTRPLGALRGWAPEGWARAFLDGYREVDPSMDAETIRRYHDRIRPFLESDREAELRRRATGVRWLPYRVWRAAGWNRWERFVASLDTSRERPDS